MRKIFTIALLAVAMTALAQDLKKLVTLRNDELKLTMKINCAADSIDVPHHELLGKVFGYLMKDGYTVAWVVVAADVKNDKKARLTFVNEYGSDDFEADLIVNKDQTYTLKNMKGSPLKMPVDRKWEKMPGAIIFKQF